jgi:hypothetical protein
MVERRTHFEHDKESKEDVLSSTQHNPLNNIETHSKVLRIKVLFPF